ncbi:MAG: CoB--CoM heterodisulfide reductase iron-sulfur subunit B family protein [Dehalococcoidia bacterium]|nr:CoB--CoM heterodisulfide reductase iron-sulfur subunit B family protein [Dehalococcoidia bacterium]
MKVYTYFPGCSSSEGTAVAYGESIKAIAGAIGMELVELEDWNCCGSTPYSSTDELGSLCVAARNLALAEKAERDMVTPCSACFTVMNRAKAHLREYPDLRAKVKECLKEAGLEYGGGVRVRHLFEAIYNDIGFGTIAAKMVSPLKGLKVAAYYGCQLVRPESDFDDPNNPKSLEFLVTSLGAEAVPFAMRDRCCGGSLVIPELDLTLGLLHKVFESAAAGGARAIVTVCPLCQTNLDAYQDMVNKKFKTSYNMPVLFFSQLIGVALGMSPKALALDRGLVPAKKVLASYYSAVAATGGGA